jgi:adenylate cyclase
MNSAMADAKVPSDAPSGIRRLIAILHADMVGYSRLIAADDAGTLLRFSTLRRDLIGPAVQEHGGRIVNMAGDSFLMAFDSIEMAVRCAIAMQRCVPHYDGDNPPERRIRFRVGVNIGDVIVNGTDLCGDGVNVAARLQARCPPGEICISRSVRDHVRDHLGLRIEELGTLALKNTVRPIEAFVIRLEERTGAQHRSPVVRNVAAAQPDKPSIAILPFANMSADPDQEFLADGIAEDIITDLSRSRSLLVIARNSSFAYRGRDVDVRQIAQELNVRYVNEGSVRRIGDRVRVTTQLVDAETGNHLWADRFDRELADIFRLQDEIVRLTVRAIHPEISLAEQRRAMLRPPEGLGAWEAYQRGLWYRAKGGATENQIARGYFERAIEIDPAFASSYHAVARSYFDDASLYFSQTFDAAAALAEPYARRAVVLDANDSEAYAALALVAAAKGDLAAELACAEQALLLDPNCASAHLIKGACLVCSAATRVEGCHALLRSLRLNPNDPRNWWTWHGMAIGRYLLEDYEGAAEAANLAIRTWPAGVVYRWLIAALGQLGRRDAASGAIRQAAQSLAPTSFDEYACRRLPWLGDDDHTHLQDGLRMAGWEPGGDASSAAVL